MTGPADELVALERRGWEALSGPKGPAFYRDVMADDGLMVFPGLVMDKGAAIRAITEAAPWTTVELIDIRAAMPTPNVGVVTYRAEARRGSEASYRALMSTVYAWHDDAWRLVLHQQTPLP